MRGLAVFAVRLAAGAGAPGAGAGVPQPRGAAGRGPGGTVYAVSARRAHARHGRHGRRAGDPPVRRGGGAGLPHLHPGLRLRELRRPRAVLPAQAHHPPGDLPHPGPALSEGAAAAGRADAEGGEGALSGSLLPAGVCGGQPEAPVF